MKILFLTNYYPPYESGGYEQLCHEVVQAMSRRGYQTVVVTSNYKVTDEAALDEPDIYRVLNTEIDWRPYKGTISVFAGRRQRLEESIQQFNAVLDDVKPDVLFVWGMWNLPRQLLLSAQERPALKIIYYIADYWPTLPDAHILHWRKPARSKVTAPIKGLLGHLASRLETQTADITPQLEFDRVLCVSDAVRQRLIRDGIQPKESQVVYNGIDLSPFLEASKGHSLTIHTPVKLIYMGRLAQDKGVHTIIEAVAQLKRRGTKATLTLLGAGDQAYKDRLLELCQTLDVSDLVDFRGFVPREQIPEILVEHDILVFSSVWAEPLARTVQEAMAVGLVVVGTLVGGMGEILRDHVNGLAFEPEDASDLASQIETITTKPALYAQFSAAGKETVTRQFDIQRMFDEVEATLQEFVYDHMPEQMIEKI